MKKTIIIGGAAGAGINTAEMYIERLATQSELLFLSYKNYESRIRGGYNYTTVTFSDAVVHSVESKADIFVALNREALNHSKEMIKAEGQVVTLSSLLPDNDQPHITVIDEKKLMEEVKDKHAKNIASVGAAARLLGFEGNDIETIGKWNEAVNKTNAKAFQFGFDIAKPIFTLEGQRPFTPIMLNGNQSVALGALSAGLSFYSAYPMAPSTGIMTYLSANMKSMNIIVEQVEDEIAAMMAAIGASSNGVRAMTGTSGGGFALMVEALGFAAVSETPLVVCNVQRPGPATGLPTRTEQADLSFVVSASQGEFARIVLAPRDVEDCFYTTFRAFNLADKYGVPVIILTDQLLADSVQAVKAFDLDSLKVERFLQPEIVPDYKRYDYNRISGGRKYPGIDAETLVMTDSHVHDEYGHVTENADATVKLKNKFLKRIEAIKEDLVGPLFYGDKDYETLLVCWGSTYGAAKDAVDLALAKGHKIGLVSFTDVFPIREDILEQYIKPQTKVINIEANAQNQFGKLLRMETGYRWHHAINRYDGRPFVAAELLEEIEVKIND